MSASEVPSIGEILKPIDKSMKVSSRAENYLQYYDVTKDRNENEEHRKQNSMDVSNNYYDLATDFYEYGWGESFHFAVLSPGESRDHSFAKYEYTLALKLGLKPKDLVLDLGCGIGGPARHIAAFSDATIVGLNCNDYQLNRAKALTKKACMEHQCSFVKGDFNNLPYEECTFDKVYAIEATCHSDDLSKVYGEAYRVLRPGGMFAVYEWAMTPAYDPENAHHVKLKEDILEGDGLADLATIPDVLMAAKKVGFDVVEAGDRATVSSQPWFSVLQPNRSFSDLRSTPLGRWLTHVMLMTLETIGLAPKGSVTVHRTLCKGADALVAAGKEGIFTPMFLMVLQKPADRTD